METYIRSRLQKGDHELEQSYLVQKTPKIVRGDHLDDCDIILDSQAGKKPT